MPFEIKKMEVPYDGSDYLAMTQKYLPEAKGRRLRFVSSGAFARVYVHRKGRVLKITSDRAYACFIKALSKLEKQNPFFPVIYSATEISSTNRHFLVVEMERLSHKKSGYDERLIGLYFDFDGWFVESDDDGNPYDSEKDFWMMEKIYPEAKEATKLLKTVGRKNKIESDICGRNIMYRKDGIPVITDPFCY